VHEAQEMLGEEVAVYLDGGPAEDSVPSTIIDVSGEVVRVLRLGAIPLDLLREVAPEVQAPGRA
jgi:tRNA A37 threonylcarbamoyladenosine synthetase subunit TsaC/SUA5/YrdC